MTYYVGLTALLFLLMGTGCLFVAIAHDDRDVRASFLFLAALLTGIASVGIHVMPGA